LTAPVLFSMARSALDYQSRKATRDAPVIERMKGLAAQYPRFGRPHRAMQQMGAVSS
jgi:hypothetical protein